MTITSEPETGLGRKCEAQGAAQREGWQASHQDYWRRFTRSGNKAYASEMYLLAAQSYEKALLQAEIQLELARHGWAENAVPMLVVALHNSADNLRALGEDDQASALYRMAFNRIIDLIEADTLPPALRQEARHNLPQAMTGLVAHLKARGAPMAEISSAVTRARGVHAASLPEG